MLKHLVHGLGERAEIEHGGAVLGVTIRRRATAHGAPCSLEFDAGDGMVVEGPATGDDGRIWHRVRHGDAVLCLRVGYEYRDTRPIIYIDAPLEWRVRWAGAPAGSGANS